MSGVKIIDSRFHFASGNTLTLCNAGVTVSNSTPGAPVIIIGGADSSNSLALYNATASMSSTDLFAANPLALGGATLTNTGNLTLGGATVQDFYLGTNASVMDATSNLTLNGTINVAAGNGFGPGAYPLFNYSGVLGGSGSNQNNLSLVVNGSSSLALSSPIPQCRQTSP